jgi:protoporphyrinogen oxidase
LINNIYYQNRTKSEGNYVLSVSVIKPHQLSKDKLINQVEKELKEYCNIECANFLRYYKIKQALPIMHTVNYMMPPSETQLKDRVFLAGDQLSNGSLNAAMLNGESAARAVIAKIQNGLINVN